MFMADAIVCVVGQFEAHKKKNTTVFDAIESKMLRL
jgi:hypothetical protein